MSEKQQLPYALPSEMGVDPKALLNTLDAAEKQKIGLHGITILRHGHIIAEGWWAPYSPDYTHMLYSLSKSFTSTAIGFAVQEELLKLDDRVVDFFPDKLTGRPCEQMEQLRVRNLLSMATGHEADPEFVFYTEDWVKTFLTSYIGNAPGSHFLYNTSATYMLSAIIRKVSGQNTGEYLRSRLFEPLGIENWWWEADPSGTHTGGFGLNFTTGNIAKFGQFLLQKGMWNGKQLLDSHWIEEATSFQIQNTGTKDWGQGYGYQFWRCVPEGVFRGDGAMGQLCVVLPKQDMVIAINAGLGDMQEEMDLLWDNLLPGVHDNAFPADDAAQKELSLRLASLRITPPEGMESCETAHLISGSRYELSPNPLELTAITFRFGEQTEVVVEYPDKTVTLPIGYGNWVSSNIGMSRNEVASVAALRIGQSACAGAWNAGEYHLTIQLTSTPCAVHMIAGFDENALILDCSIGVTLQGPQSARIIGRRVSQANAD